MTNNASDLTTPTSDWLPKHSKWPWSGFAVAFVLGIIVGMLFFSGSSRRSLSLSAPNGYTLNLDATEEDLSFDSLYSSITAVRAFRDALIERLSDDQIYQVTDARLADALHEHLCDPIPDQPLIERMNASRTCAELPVARRLRQLADMREVPFQYVGREIRVGVPSSEDQPQPRKAHACNNSEFRDREVQLTNPKRQVSVTVTASGSYDCTGFNQYPDIQLSYTDAQKLFNRPLDKYEDAIAVVLD